jgi:hypothetical protein
LLIRGRLGWVLQDHLERGFAIVAEAGIAIVAAAGFVAVDFCAVQDVEEDAFFAREKGQ